MANLTLRSKQEVLRTDNALTLTDQIKPGLEWVCADNSSSMSELLEGSKQTRIDALNLAVAELDPRIQWIGFNMQARVNLERSKFIASGGTYFQSALKLVLQFRPSYVVFMSDGEDGSSESGTLSLCEQIAETAIIETLFIGGSASEGRTANAERLLRQMAEIGHGSFRKWSSEDALKQLSLTSIIAGLLPPPAKAIEL